MIIKKGDNVKIMAGKDRGKTGKVAASFPRENKVLIDGINLRKKHLRPRKQGQKGQIVQVPHPLFASSVMLVCPSCGKTARVGRKIAGDKKLRVCKKCGAEI